MISVAWEADKIPTGPGLVKRHGQLDVNWKDPRNTGGGGTVGPPGPTGPTGPAGADGQGFDYKGDWINGGSYAVNDVVRRLGSTYICTVALASSTTPPDTDTAHWELFTAKGDTGPGIPTGGTTGQYLRKSSGTDYATGWDTLDIADVAGLQTALDGKQAIPGVWTAFSPTIWNAGWSLGNAKVEAVYVTVGSLVVARYWIQFGSTSSYGTDSPIIGLPTAIRNLAATSSNIFCQLFDQSTNKRYSSFPASISTGIYLSAVSATGNDTPITLNYPFTWTAGDEIRLAITYEKG